MMPEIEERFVNLERQRAALIDPLRTLREEQLAFKPTPDQWSIVEVLQHLAASEEGTLRYMGKKNQAATLPKASPGCALRSALLTVVLRSPFRFRVPSRLLEPKKKQSLIETIEQWDLIRQGLREFLETLPPERTRVEIFRHPLAGYFNIFHTLRFFEEHTKHHEKQIKRIQNTPHFPRSN